MGVEDRHALTTAVAERLAGAVGWDAACLLNSSQGPERAEAASAASGIRLDRAELKLWRVARDLQVAVRRAFLSS